VTWKNVVALSGGVGGARLVYGLDRVLPDGALSVVVNTGDDFTHWGLQISPDLDTVMYTLAGLSHDERGWGLREESFQVLEAVRKLGGDAWFQLGDTDLATHLRRTEALRAGNTLTQVTDELRRALGVRSRLLPMSDLPAPTLIDTRDDGTLSFQDWLVRRRAVPHATGVRFGAAPPPAPGLLDAIEAAELIVIGPSNPYVSIEPILALPGVRDAVARRPVVAVSPIVAGAAIKGPLAEMLAELAGEPPSAGAVARCYGGLLAGMVVERGDEGSVGALPVRGASTIMRSRADREQLAAEVLSFAEGLAR
jgi:LPPG:FO 2-phospho-L-lactate transferase